MNINELQKLFGNPVQNMVQMPKFTPPGPSQFKTIGYTVVVTLAGVGIILLIAHLNNKNNRRIIIRKPEEENKK